VLGLWLVGGSLLACSGPQGDDSGEPSPPSDTDSVALPTADTSSAGPTGASGHTGAATGATAATGDTAPTDTGTVPLNCAIASTAPSRITNDFIPVPFSPRSTGEHWFAEPNYAWSGVFSGASPATAVLVHDIPAEHVYEDPYGTLHVLGDGMLHRVAPGGAPVLVASNLTEGIASHSDLAVHPSGTVAFVTYELELENEDGITTVLADGTVRRDAAVDIGLGRPLAVEWSADRSTMWVLDTALHEVDVDADGVPDWATLRAVPVPPFVSVWGSDLAVDACDGLWLYWTLGFGVGGLARLDPATGSVVSFPGRIDQGYGFAALRFGRVAGEEEQLRTMSGGWGVIALDWLVWDVGVGEAPWP